jgi:hypothetical protein
MNKPAEFCVRDTTAMKPKLLLCLALVLSGGLFGYSATNINSSGLTLSILASSLKIDPAGQNIHGIAVLKNKGSNSLLICTNTTRLDGYSTNGYGETILTTDFSWGNAPSAENFAAAVKMVKPGDTVQFPISENPVICQSKFGTNIFGLKVIWINDNANMPLYEQNSKIKMWRGRIESEPIYFRITK